MQPENPEARKDTRMNTSLPARLSETIETLGIAAREVRDEVRADRVQREVVARVAAEQQKRYNRRTTALLAVLAVLVAALAALGVANRQLNEQNAEIIAEIRSCTTVGGACYEQSSKRTNEAVSRLITEMTRAQIAIAVCAHSNPGADADAIETCAAARATIPSETEEPPPSGEGPAGEPIPTD